MSTMNTTGFPRATAAGRLLETQDGRVFYSDGTARAAARVTEEGAVQVRGWHGWTTVESFEATGGTVVDSIAATKLARELGES